MKAVRVFGMTMLLASTLLAQTATQDNGKPSKPVDPDVQALKEAVAAQQAQIQALSQQLQQTNQQLHETNEQLRLAQQQMQQAQTAAVKASVTAQAPQVQAAEQPQTVSALSSDIDTLKTASTAASPEPTLKNTVFPLQDSAQSSSQDQQPQVLNSQMESPITIRFRGINITPGGYAAAEFVRRSRALSADLPTPFNSLTMPGASQAQMSEFFGSGRQSKITTFVEGRVKNVDLSSYVSADFLSAGVTSTSTETDSYTLRLRQAWAQAKFDNGWSFLGGQSWSLVTEDAKGIAPDDDMGKTNDVRPKTIDPSYNVGFVFARQYGARLTKRFSDKLAVAVAIENPQASITTHGNASNFLVGQNGASNSYNTTATYSFNPAPDLIAKVAFDPGFGHYEIFGLTDRFTDRVFPCVEFEAGNPTCTATDATSATAAHNVSKQGGGVGISGRWVFAHHITFGLKGMGGSGIGRYGPAGLPDASINADGTIHLVKNLLGLGTLEWRSKKWDIYGYGGVEYAARTYSFDPLADKGTGADVGYGAPTFNNTGCYTETAPGSGGFSPGTLANCTGDSRAVIEGTAGFWYRFYSGPRGRFQFGTQYSYVTRNTWSGVGGLPAGSPGLEPNGLDSMIFTSFRYYLP
jgi:hypothetical protein